jgi:hypothetical protein
MTVKNSMAGPQISPPNRSRPKAGFKNRADLGYYLRSLLASHQDTLTVPVNLLPHKIVANLVVGVGIVFEELSSLQAW